MTPKMKSLGTLGLCLGAIIGWSCASISLGLPQLAGEQGQAETTPEPPPALSEELIVYEDSAFRDPFSSIQYNFEQEKTLQLSLHDGSSDELRQELRHGAVANVFVLESAHAAGLSQRVEDFAADELVLVVHPSLQERIKGFLDLAPADKVIVVEPDLMVGRHTAAVLKNAERAFGEKSTEAFKKMATSKSPAGVLFKVSRHIADAGLAYRTQVLRAHYQLVILELPRELKPFVKFAAGRSRPTASPWMEPWIQMGRQPWGRKQLEEAGFRLDTAALEGAFWEDRVDDSEPKPLSGSIVYGEMNRVCKGDGLVMSDKPEGQGNRLLLPYGAWVRVKQETPGDWVEIVAEGSGFGGYTLKSWLSQDCSKRPSSQ